MAYASGKYAISLCDRCAFEYPYNQLRKEWNGLKTCPECWEPKHPQLEPLPHVMDPEALYEARPDTDKEVGEGYVVIVYTNIYESHYINSDIIGTNFLVPEMTGAVGEVTIITS
jgi:hypothetical protein|tara:strand:- start:328 stop:669 length:342 start_codon:yes stop_codon:yes gene_type:complete